MEHGDTDSGSILLSEEEWHDVVSDVFEDIFEQHGLASAVGMFLAALGQWAVETATVPQLALSMSGCLDVATDMMNAAEPVTVN
jgi:vacuolar-type H+-ATPase subunit B/Vma2